MKFFDSHCHLQLKQYNSDLAEVLARMQERQVGGMVVGTDYAESKAGLELAKQHDFLWASVGLHPTDNLSEHFDISKYLELAQDPKVVAIGECGLDYFHSGATEEERTAQKDRFIKQIELALEVGKPLIIHCRDNPKAPLGSPSAHLDLQEILQTYNERLKQKNIPIVIHFFTGSGESAQKYLELGCYLSFAGPITYTDMYNESIRIAPIDRILSETDSPFAAPVPYRGKRNEPGYVEEVVKKLAAVKGIAVEEMASQIILNSQRVFGLH